MGKRVASIAVLAAVVAASAGCGSTISGSAQPDSRLLVMQDFPGGFQPTDANKQANPKVLPPDCKNFAGWDETLDSKMSEIHVKREVGNKLVQMQFAVGKLGAGDYSVGDFEKFFDTCPHVSVKYPDVRTQYHFVDYDADKGGADDAAWKVSLEQIMQEGGVAAGVSILYAGRVGDTTITAEMDQLSPGSLPPDDQATDGLVYEKQFRNLVNLQVSRVRGAH